MTESHTANDTRTETAVDTAGSTMALCRKLLSLPKVTCANWLGRWVRRVPMSCAHTKTSFTS